MSAPIDPHVRAEHRGVPFLLRVRKDPLNFFVEMMEARGPYCWFEIMGDKVLLLNDAHGIQQVLRDKHSFYKKGKFNKVLKPMLGEGIFMSEGSLWQKQRRESARNFAEGHFPEMTAQMQHACMNMIARMKARAQESQLVDLNMETMWFTLDVVLRALYHEDREDVAHDMKSSLGLLLKDAEARIWSLLSWPQSWVMHLPKYQHAKHFLDDLVADLIAKRQENGQHPEDLLSTLIRNYEDHPKDQRLLRDQIMSFLLAGHETTANALAWCFYEISQRPEVKARIEEEIAHEIGNSPLSFENLSRLKYTSAVFDEVLRLYPPVWTMSRTAVQDHIITLDDGRELFIPEDATIMLCAYSMHRNDRYWRNPCAFDPERFLSETSRPQFAYFPFSRGPRLCLGHKFARIESLLAITLVLQQFDISLLPGQKIQPEPIITLRPDRPVLFKLKEKQGSMRPPKIDISDFSNAPASMGQCPVHAA